MFYMERKRDEDWQRSEAVLHYKGEQDLSAEKLPENYTPHWSERDEQTRPREMFSMGNSYGDLFVAANRKKEMTLTVSEKRRHDSETLGNDHKKLNGERRRSVVDPFGWTFTNSFNPANSAFAYKTRKIEPTRRVLGQLKKNLDKKGNSTIESILPFLRLEKDKKRLQELVNQTAGIKKGEKEISGLEQEKELLTKGILQKEQMQAKFFRKLHLALEKAKLLTDPGRAEWLENATLTGAAEIPEALPRDDEDNDEETNPADPAEGFTGTAPEEQGPKNNQ